MRRRIDHCALREQLHSTAGQANSKHDASSSKWMSLHLLGCVQSDGQVQIPTPQIPAAALAAQHPLVLAHRDQALVLAMRLDPE